MLLAPVVIREILAGRHAPALALFAAATVTDGVDGYLARRLKRVTRAGAYLDPIADKLLLSGVYLALAVIGSVPWWFVGLVFGRDILILAAAALALVFTGMRSFPPSVWGKLSTIFQSATAVVWMIRNASPGVASDSLAMALVWLTAGITIWSGMHYGWRGWHALQMH
jgi:cardiolipin synthase